MKGWLVDGLLVAGGIAVSIGAGMIYAPAGVITAGLLLLAAGVLVARSS